jgi:peptidoglycan/xylan/chitin deacetylase (PgdA/CDA1 family)
MEALAYRLAHLFGITRLFAFLNRKRGFILMYHGVRAGAGMPGSSQNHVPVDLFRRQMAYLAAHRRVAPLSRLVQWLQEGHDIPDYTVVLTFDDGYRNIYTQAYPILRHYRLSATVFVTTAFIGTHRALWQDRLAHAIFCTTHSELAIDGERYPLTTPPERDRAYRRLRARAKRVDDAKKNRMVDSIVEQLDADLQVDEQEGDWAFLTWQQVSEMDQGGIDFGSHTENHVILTRVPAEVAEAEVQGAKQLLEERLHRECTLFCYPNGRPGDFDDNTKQMLQYAGFEGAVLAISGSVAPGDDPFTLKRVGISGDEGYWHFVATVTGLRPFLASLKRMLKPRRARG